jgi:hypothetical protein
LYVVAVLKVSDKISRIPKSEVRVGGSGSVPKCRGSATLHITVHYDKIPEHLGDIFVVDPEKVCGALLLELVVGGDLDGGARLQLHLLPPIILHNINQ